MSIMKVFRKEWWIKQGKSFTLNFKKLPKQIIGLIMMHIQNYNKELIIVQEMTKLF